MCAVEPLKRILTLVGVGMRTYVNALYEALTVMYHSHPQDSMQHRIHRWVADLFFQVLNFIIYTGREATIHQVATMLATSKNVLFAGHNHYAKHWY